jgi:spermidine synthase
MSATIPAPVAPAIRARFSLNRKWPFYILFFISGSPALVYQIVWQRSLFTLYGLNIQSVTVIVTVFMLGLGLGSLAGGRLSAIKGINTLRAFGSIELLIGLFGTFSLRLFHWIAQLTAGASTLSTAAISFFLLLIPTMLMGSTLPLLVEHRVRQTSNVGDSVGSLYCVNTLGSAVACFLVSAFLMRILGQSGSVRVAVAVNLMVGSSALLLALFDSSNHASIQLDSPHRDPRVRNTIPAFFGMVLAGAAGFVALSYEILWYHIYSFASGSKATCFAKLLGFYLLGIAYGSFAVHEQCRMNLKDDLARTLRAACIVICIGSIVAYLVIPAVAHSVAFVSYDLTFIFVSCAAALLGAAFPVICHASIGEGQGAGKNLSYLYLSNIVGSALGSLTIGFIAMDYLSTTAISNMLLLIGLALAGILALRAKPLPVRGILASASFACVFLLLVSRALFGGLFERLMFKSDPRPETSFREVVENRSGVVTVDQADLVYGGGVYDGAFRIDPVNDTNGIFRAFAIAALHPNPRHVLVIGLSSGSWTQVLVNHPKIEDATVVEINPGYLPLIHKRPIVRSLLNNRKVHIDIDDGRRWLLAHPDSRFDFILMNTTHNWRANASNLLSVEFLQLIRKHLNAGGVLYYNTTNSERVQLTGATVYPFGLRVANFIAVSDSPIVFDRANWRRLLENYEIDGQRVFDLSKSVDRSCIDRWVAMPESHQKPEVGLFETSIEDRTSLLLRFQGLQIVTDDNMGTEWQ